jgi:hypothetical protein
VSIQFGWPGSRSAITMRTSSCQAR